MIFPNALRAAIGEHLADLTGYILVSLLGTLIKSIPLAMINTMTYEDLRTIARHRLAAGVLTSGWIGIPTGRWIGH